MANKIYKTSTRDSFVPSGWKPTPFDDYPRIRGWGGKMYGGLAEKTAQELLRATTPDVRGTVEMYPYLTAEDQKHERVGCHVFTNLFVGDAREVAYQHVVSYPESSYIWDLNIPGAEVAAWKERANGIDEPSVEEQLADPLAVIDDLEPVYVGIPEMQEDFLAKEDDPWWEPA